MYNLIAASLIWGLSFSLSKMALQSLSPFDLVALRMILATVFSFLLVFLFEKKSSRSFFSWAPFTLGLFEFSGTYILYTYALNYLPSGVVGTLTLMTPIFTLLLGRLLKLQKVRVTDILALFLSILGALLCLPKLSAGLPSGSVFGLLLVLLSNLSFALGNVFISKLESEKKWEQTLTTMGLGWGAILAIPIALVNHHRVILENTSNFKIWILPLYLGFIATGLGFYLWNRGVQKVSAFPASLIGNFKSPLSVLWGIVLLGETFKPIFVVGFIFLFASALLSGKSQRKTQTGES